MKPRLAIGMLAVITLHGGHALAQQKITPPVASYWVSADTASGLPMGGGAPSMMDIGRMMLGGGAAGGPVRTLLLELGSQRAAGGAPSAAHEIPPDLRMGASLPLESPQRVRPEPREDGQPEQFERPRGRLLIFWGCGEQAGPGQPFIVDFARLAQGEWPQGLFSRRVNVQRGPSPSRSKTYGEWPNARYSQRVPAEGSLRGDHAVRGNYTPDIRFSLDRHDFMDAVALNTARAGGAARLSWNAVGGATGYYASAMGGRDGSEDLVFWSSSTSREFGDLLMTWLPPAEVARLVKERVVMAPATTECAVPAQFVAAAPMAFVRFIAYGDEANFVHPPRPKDPAAVWNQEWAVKVRFKSTATALLGETAASAPRGRGRGAEPAAPAEGAPAQGSGLPTPADAVQEGIKALRGIFGR
jgi:hypothetical protein